MTKVLTSFSFPRFSHALYPLGTSFTPQGVLNTTADVVDFLDVIDQPFTTTPSAAFQGDIKELLELYPDNPSLGSPFGTGNNTFGAGAEYKRAAAIVDDVAFQAPRRAWIQAASKAGVKTFGYLFTDQNAALQNPSLGGECWFRSCTILHTN